MTELEFKASRLKTKIRTAKRQDHFFDAAKYEAELELIEKQIENEKR